MQYAFRIDRDLGNVLCKDFFAQTLATANAESIMEASFLNLGTRLRTAEKAGDVVEMWVGWLEIMSAYRVSNFGAVRVINESVAKDDFLGLGGLEVSLWVYASSTRTTDAANAKKNKTPDQTDGSRRGIPCGTNPGRVQGDARTIDLR